MKKTLRFVLYGLLALVITACVAIFLIVKLALAPASGEWSTTVKAGPLNFEIGVPTAVRVATSAWFAPYLDGRSLDTRFGTMRFAWKPAGELLEMQCAPCSAEVPALGTQPIRVERLVATVKRDGNTLNGSFEATPRSTDTSRLQGQWDGKLMPKNIHLNASVQDAPIERWYAVLVPALPELQRARIGGTLALRGQLVLPEATFAVQPVISQFTVEGLGTEAMLGARTSCGPSAKLANDSWLARAVIAAEDQRFFTHGGYDLTEILASIDNNQKPGQTRRGGSTLTQQLAKLLVTGSDRTAERKLRELLYAVEMEQTLGKARILQLYLDNAPWGGNLCGAEAAARRYFKRGARTLEPAQAVWLAAMLHKPQAVLEQWRRDGQIDADRIKWIAEGIRGISRNQREALLKSVAAAKFMAPEAATQ
ncbi:Transglycosylase [Variovorax sp. YR750]|uniref:biosynthetic peptidoglycan transglycosylase n=1 Tax=Variovorax sp. YR750 TaxID=1884384 RepID=UPI0008BF2E1C|nr:biosynthetic peptidoglycan transglycosylase [Variovorax sp. YR750]SEK63848.1 Transglycosylase [Variovorax sp. YR750]